MNREDEEQKRRPKMIDYIPEGVPCKSCKHSLPVGESYDIYYCVEPESVAGIHHGDHVCGRGQPNEINSESL